MNATVRDIQRTVLDVVGLLRNRAALESAAKYHSAHTLTIHAHQRIIRCSSEKMDGQITGTRHATTEAAYDPACIRLVSGNNTAARK
jgi:hypothetical protein